MREPFESLLAPFHGHWWVEQHLQGATPEFDRILTDPYWNTLSGGEATLILLALAIYNGDEGATVAAVLRDLDEENFRRALWALAVARDVPL